MNDLLTQIVLGAREKGREGWMNILFIVGLAIFYVVGSIAKAKAKKSEQQEQPSGKPGPHGAARGVQRQRPVATVAPGLRQRAIGPQGRKIARPMPAGRGAVSKGEELGVLVPLETPKAEGISPALGLVEADELVTKPLKGREGVPAATTDTSEGKHLSEILSDYSDPEELKRAILHYEILGRPVSLRDPGSQIIGR